MEKITVPNPVFGTFSSHPLRLILTKGDNYWWALKIINQHNQIKSLSTSFPTLSQNDSESPHTVPKLFRVSARCPKTIPSLRTLSQNYSESPHTVPKLFRVSAYNHRLFFTHIYIWLINHIYTVCSNGDRLGFYMKIRIIFWDIVHSANEIFTLLQTPHVYFSPCQAISLSQMADSIQGLLPHQSCTQPMSNHTTLYTVFYIKQMQLGCKYNEWKFVNSMQYPINSLSMS